MNTKYIKMCEKAEEIQQFWDPIPGDWCIDKFRSRLNKKDGLTLCIWFNLFNNTLCTILLGTRGMDYNKKEKFFWLPALNQLINFIPINCNCNVKWIHKLTSINNYSEHLISIEENIYFENKCSDCSSTLEEVILKMVMELLYKKIWNGEDWITNA